MDRIVIIGMGLLGGSIGLALKRSKVQGLEIVGVDTERDAVVRAQRKGAIDKWERPASEAVKTANLVIVATPILTMPEVFREIAPALKPGAVVTDVGSTKTEVMKWAGELLPASVHFVGGHPMAGKEVAGIDNAEASLFEGCTWCILPSPSAAPGAVEAVVGLAQTVGATPYFVDAPEHDTLVAGISHLPLLLASALVEVTTRSPSWKEMSRLASSGYRDTTRLAGSEPSLSRGISLTNQASLIHWLDAYTELLKEYRDKLAAGGEELQPHFTAAQEARDRWFYAQRREAQERDPVMADIPSFRQQMVEMFGGRLFGGRRQEQVEEQLINRGLGKEPQKDGERKDGR